LSDSIRPRVVVYSLWSVRMAMLEDTTLLTLRDRFAVEQLDAIGLDGTCMVCFTFGRFEDGKPQPINGQVYYPPLGTVDGPHVHNTHQAVDRDESQAAIETLRTELTELASLQPDFTDLVERERERLTDLTDDGPNPTLGHISAAARLALHVHRLAL
jgi:hypothetical protein